MAGENRKRTIEVTDAELHLFIAALDEKYEFLRECGNNEPLTSQDPDTRRYEIFDQAAAVAVRANEFRAILADG